MTAGLVDGLKITGSLIGAGLLVGSFVGVLMERMPRGEPWAFTRSRCSLCRTVLSPFELVPILSFVLQRGRCRHCGGHIPFMTLGAEVVTAAVFAILPWAVWPTAGSELAPMEKAAWLLPFGALAVAVSGIDLQTRRLPNAMTYGAIVYGYLARSWMTANWLEPAVGAVTGGALVVLVVIASRGGMGLGDAKWLAGIGALLGWRGAVVAFFAGAAYGAAVGLILLGTRRIERRTPIPFGPFLTLGAMTYLFFPQAWPL